jgi:hypothetical protein
MLATRGEMAAQLFRFTFAEKAFRAKKLQMTERTH